MVFRGEVEVEDENLGVISVYVVGILRYGRRWNYYGGVDRKEKGIKVWIWCSLMFVGRWRGVSKGDWEGMVSEEVVSVRVR